MDISQWRIIRYLLLVCQYRILKLVFQATSAEAIAFEDVNVFIKYRLPMDHADS